MSKKIALAAFGYILVTFALGYSWHLILFRDVYESFGVFTREKPIIPMGICAMTIQGFILASLYSRWAAGTSRPLIAAVGFNLLMGLFFVSGTVLALAAKAEIVNLGAWFGYNLSFSMLQFLLSGFVFAFVFRKEPS